MDEYKNSAVQLLGSFKVQTQALAFCFRLQNLKHKVSLSLVAAETIERL